MAYNIPGVDNTFASYYYSSNESSTDVAVGALTKMSMFSKGWINYTYDAQGRLFKRNIGDLLNESYAYLSKPGDANNSTTTWIEGKAIWAPDNTSLKYFSYEYNSLGYIESEHESKSGTGLEYTYDNQGQLLTAEKFVNSFLFETYAYTYDTYGNLRTATDGTTSHTYTYGDSDWADLLTAYDGTALTYDAIGNPTSYYNGSSYTMTWRNGRELQNLTKGGKKTSYEYDVDGLRNLKTNADGSYSVYYWLGNLLLAEERHTGNSTRVLVFSYDENNSPIGFQFKTNDGPWYYYLYAKNIQGDIVALYRRDINADGTRSATHIANYEYDPWGKILSIKNAAGQDISGNPDNSANVNPLRYRGYYYDNESGFYYLQSRYYDSSIGRFINADSYASTGQDFLGYNMFAYCNNNPTCLIDNNGTLCTHSIGVTDTGAHYIPHVRTSDETKNKPKRFAEPDASIDVGFNVDGIYGTTSVSASHGDVHDDNTNLDYYFDIGKVEASAGVGWNGINYSAGAYLTEGGVTCKIFGANVTFCRNIGIGSSVQSNSKGMEFGVSCLIGFSITISWDN